MVITDFIMNCVGVPHVGHHGIRRGFRSSEGASTGTAGPKFVDGGHRRSRQANRRATEKSYRDRLIHPRKTRIFGSDRRSRMNPRRSASAASKLQISDRHIRKPASNDRGTIGLRFMVAIRTRDISVGGELRAGADDLTWVRGH
jgi:hypothetical protein